MKFIRFLLRVLRGEQGSILGSVLGWLGADERGNPPIPSDFNWDKVPDIKKKLSENILGKIGTSTPYKYNDAFTIDQPDIEKQAESNILGYLKNPTSNVSDYSEATKKYSEANKASREIAYEDERKKSQNMYNRLGLVSSTPGLSAMSDINRKQTAEGNLFDSELMYKNLDRQLQAQGLDVKKLNAMLNEATGLGKTQRGSQEWSIGTSLEDLIRQVNEEQMYSNSALAYLGKGAVSPMQQYGGEMTQWQMPNNWEYLQGGLEDANSEALQALMMMGG